jgi:ATP-dependent protease ClpP protease subunit
MIELNLNGVVGEDFGVGLVQFALREGGPINIQLNSGGGSAWEGVAIYSALAAHPDDVSVEIIGIAASAASLLAMAGRTIKMRTGSLMMIHDPALLTVGNTEDHRKSMDILEKTSDSYARIYAGRSGLPTARIRKMMADETWFSPDEAVRAGFATATEKREAAPFASFDYSKYSKTEKAFAGARNDRTGWQKIIKPMNDQFNRHRYIS